MGVALNCQTHLYDFIQGVCLLIAGGCRKSPGQREKQCATERNHFFHDFHIHKIKLIEW